MEVGLRETVLRRARLASDSGLHGIVCSPLEVALVRPALRAAMEIVTPGIRPPDWAADDQKRTATPASAIAAGSTKLVIGRPITHADSPPDAFDAIAASLG